MLLPAQSSDSSVPDSGNDHNDSQASESDITSWSESFDAYSDRDADPISDD